MNYKENEALGKSSGIPKNPFKEFGYTPKIATLSKGKYLEFHDLDSIVKIGSFSFHVKKKQVTGYTRIDPNDLESGLSPEVISRWLSPDPLAEEFPSWTPYHYAHNNPIRYIDPDGRSAFDVIIKGKLADKATEQLNASTSLEITRDQKTGKLSATGEAKTEHDQQLLDAIQDEKITVKINATNKNKLNGKFIFGDSFQGSREKNNGEVIAKHTLNPNQAKVIEDFAEMPEGSIAKHAVLEAYSGAQNDPGAYPQQKDAYLRAHDATNAIYPAGDFRKAADEKSIRVETWKSPFSKVQVLLVRPGKQRSLFD